MERGLFASASIRRRALPNMSLSQDPSVPRSEYERSKKKSTKDRRDTLRLGSRRLLCAINIGSCVVQNQALARGDDRLSLIANIGSLVL